MIVSHGHKKFFSRLRLPGSRPRGIEIPRRPDNAHRATRPALCPRRFATGHSRGGLPVLRSTICRRFPACRAEIRCCCPAKTSLRGRRWPRSGRQVARFRSRHRSRPMWGWDFVGLSLCRRPRVRGARRALGRQYGSDEDCLLQTAAIGRDSVKDWTKCRLPPTSCLS